MERGLAFPLRLAALSATSIGGQKVKGFFIFYFFCDARVREGPMLTLALTLPSSSGAEFRGPTRP